ncbi:hypothetical protein CK203_060964 [Vitis vinifera]|uniref:Uncharacterized protein n=1 Tax=Vitis vinifera TaxID=29760 RepID=A0A438G968_VITVI|nr:hypothetical protein CK203_060964 [Vitis vinifera]
MSHPLAPSAKGWMTCSPRPSALISHYEPPRGFLVPKFSTYDGTNDPFDHIMHYRQLMTLDIGNDAPMQSISRQPTRTGPLMVSSPTSQLCWQFQGPVRSFRGTILVLRDTSKISAPCRT